MRKLSPCVRLYRHTCVGGDKYRTVTVQRNWELWQAARALPATQEAKWFLHTLDSTEGIPGNAPEEKVTDDESHPFGVPGRDFSAEYQATSTPIYTAAQVLAMGRVPLGFVAVPMELTAEMVDAAEEAYMPFGDMALAIQSAIAVAPRPPASQEPILSNSAELARTPLTDEQINAALIAWFGRDTCLDAGYQYRMRSAINAAHGITNPTGD